MSNAISIPPIDSRAQEDLFAEMRKSLENKGLTVNKGDGELLSVLTLLYSNMLADTIKKLNRTPEKHRASFLNITHTPPRAAWPASGIVVFEVAGGYDNPVEIRNGTRVAAETGGRAVSFRLSSDLTAIPSRITDIYWCDYTRGRYGFSHRLGGFRPWNDEYTQETAYKVDFEFFNIFSVNEEALLFVDALMGDRPVSQFELLQATRWSIAASAQDEPAFTELYPQETSEGSLFLQLKEPIVDAEYVILRMEIIKPEYAGLCMKDFYIMRMSGSAAPDTVLTSSRGLNPRDFHPFAMPMRAFEECGIFCDAALSQESSKITMRFRLDFDVSEEKYSEPQEAVDYKWIMRKPLAKPKPIVHEAFAKSVRLEYWDGSTYREILDDGGSALDFTYENACVELTFDCPSDIAVCEYYGRSGYYLRLSCGECNELYMLPRRVYTPRISEVIFSYCHSEKYYPVNVTSESFGKRKKLWFGVGGQPELFECYRGNRTLLFGFDKLGWKCRVKLHINIRNGKCSDDKYEKLESAIYSDDEYKSFTALDFTGNLTTSGDLWLDIPENAQPCTRFGKERYWVALPIKSEELPIISGIHLNAQLVENKIRCEESFSYSHLKNDRIELSHNNVIRATVRVRSLTGEKMELWQEYSMGHGKFRSGFYMIDYESGLLTFPRDIVGRSVNEDILDLINVIYDVTDGNNANVAANSITRMEEDIPFIKSVRNPYAIVNGMESESPQKLASRKRHNIYDGGRIVSRRDFELFAMDNCPLVKSARCTYDEHSKTVLLAILIEKDMHHTAFKKVEKILCEAFKPLMSEGIRFDIVPWEEASP